VPDSPKSAPGHADDEPAFDLVVEALVTVKSAISEANRQIQRAIYDLAEKKASVQFLAGVSTRHGAQPSPP
jgi:hypothetical protein